jgi:hypothetical protein
LMPITFNGNEVGNFNTLSSGSFCICLVISNHTLSIFPLPLLTNKKCPENLYERRQGILKCLIAQSGHPYAPVRSILTQCC